MFYGKLIQAWTEGINGGLCGERGSGNIRRVVLVRGALVSLDLWFTAGVSAVVHS